jgi:hypothetical protein
MRNRTGAGAIAAWVTVAASFTSTSVAAEGIDGKRDVVCAVMDVVACLEEADCLQGRASSFELPEFIILDAKAKVIRPAYEGGEKAVSPVKNVERNGTHLILQGVENGRGWDIAIDTESGKMRAASVGDAVSFLAFGSCTAL